MNVQTNHRILWWPKTEEHTVDIVYVGIILLLLALSWGLVELCERLSGTGR